MKPDKYPYLDPTQPFIFDRIVATAQEMRKVQRSHPYMEKLKQEELARGDRQRMNYHNADRERQKKVDETWAARIRALPSYGVPKL